MVLGAIGIKVGIGTPVPTALLDVTGSSSSDTKVHLLNTDIGNVGLELRSSANVIQYIDFADGSSSSTDGGAPDFRNRITSSSVNLTISTNTVASGIVLLNGGNVGIGTASPPAKLSVSAGNASLALFGPNVYGGQLYVGAALDQNVAFTAQVLASDGNLHIDPAAGKNIYVGYYQARDIYLNPNGGNVGIGTASTSHKLQMAVDDAVKPTTSTWTIISDERLKHIDGYYTKGLSEILKLNPILFHYKNVGERTFDEKVLNTQAIGFSAQDVLEVFPECVGTESDGYLNLNIHAILVAQVNAIKEQQSQIEALKAENEKLKSANDAVTTDIEKIKEHLGLSCLK